MQQLLQGYYRGSTEKEEKLDQDNASSFLSYCQ